MAINENRTFFMLFEFYVRHLVVFLSESGLLLLSGGLDAASISTLAGPLLGNYLPDPATRPAGFGLSCGRPRQDCQGAGKKRPGLERRIQDMNISTTLKGSVFNILTVYNQ